MDRNYVVFISRTSPSLIELHQEWRAEFWGEEVNRRSYREWICHRIGARSVDTNLTTYGFSYRMVWSSEKEFTHAMMLWDLTVVTECEVDPW